ncbi:hypothetical protein [Paraburkholderia sp. MM5482-R1]|uniref:hypothetical protein n=1 Tax=unclassified Paraburkholderia TaxID=2615204 RepID=UPI003D243AC9
MIGDISHFKGTPDESGRTTRSLEWAMFRGWRALILTQADIELTIVPSIGGRLMSIRHRGVELAYVNEELAGRTPDGSADQWQALCGEWGFPLWGGGKTWVAPESQWPDGAPQRDLDSGPYDVLKTWCDADSIGIEIQSHVCEQTGLQIFRRVSLSPAGQWTTVHRLINRSLEVRECGIWDVLMLRRPGIVSVPLNMDVDWRDHVVPFPHKGPIGDVRDTRFVVVADGVLSAVCDEAVEFKLGIAAPEGIVDIRLLLAEGERRLTRRFDIAQGAYAHGAPVEVFNAPALPYFEVESHGVMHPLQPGNVCELHVRESVTSI